MKKPLMIGLAVLVLAGGGVALWSGNSSPERALARLATTERQASFAIENMTCALCPVTVRRAMEGVAGVSAVTIDFATKTARATFDPARTNVAAIAAASTNAGYPARAIQS